MNAHKPGPWFADENGDGTSCITKGRGIDIADTRSAVDEPQNATLIAAAPALLMAWEMVPGEVKGRILEALHKPDTEWVGKALATVGSNF